MVTWPIDFEFLGNMDCDTLRRLKLALSECRSGSTGYQMFRQVDRLLTDREGITHFKTALVGECALVDPYVNSVDFPEPNGSNLVQLTSRIQELEGLCTEHYADAQSAYARGLEHRDLPNEAIIDDCPGHHNF